LRRFVPRAEPLGDRVAPAVVSAVAGGVLSVAGDAADDAIIIGRRADGAVVVNGSTIAVAGGVLTAAQTTAIVVSGGDGDDFLKVNTANGGLHGVTLRGGNGNDTLVGGLGKDRLLGDAGNDSLFGRENQDLLRGGADSDELTGGRGIDRVLGDAGEDLVVWNEGEGSDTIDGGADTDTLEFNASADGDSITVGPHDGFAGRVLIRRENETSPPVELDVATTESVHVNPGTGEDQITVDDLAGKGVAGVFIDLGLADGTGDLVIVNGTDTPDVIQVVPLLSSVQVTGLATPVTILRAEVANDFVIVEGLGGDDTLSGGDLAALIQLTLDGGERHDRRQRGRGLRTHGERERHVRLGSGRRQRRRGRAGRPGHAFVQWKRRRRAIRRVE
jgi:Ca2+-binding RTX toxin-like protein